MADTLIIDSAAKIFADTCDKAALDAAETGTFPQALWDTVRANGFHLLALPDSGVDLGDLFAVLRVAGNQAVPLPLAETLLANRWLGYDGDELSSIGLVAGSAKRASSQQQASSESAGGGPSPTYIEVPWGRGAARVLGVTPANELFVAEPVTVTEGTNLAGEARDTVAVREVRQVPTEEPVYALLALARVAASAGALERVLDLGLRYATEREQFGRPIARFQAIQHNLAVVAAEVAAAIRATDAAIDAVTLLNGETQGDARGEQSLSGEERGDTARKKSLSREEQENTRRKQHQTLEAQGDTPGEQQQRFILEVAAAKCRVGEAAGIVAESIHQVHGAMGFTHEHELHHFTRRLWAWREEYGGEPYWQTLLGAHIATLGADRVWDFIATSR